MDGNVLILMITSPADLSRGEMINAAFSFQRQLMGQSRSVCHLSSLTPPVHPRRTRAKHVCQYIQNVHFTDLKKYAMVNDIAFVLSYFWTIIFLLLNLFLTRNEKTKPEKKKTPCWSLMTSACLNPLLCIPDYVLNKLLWRDCLA